jgi:hypothetical protein
MNSTDLVNWILKNKEWLFSGVGVVLVVFLLRWLYGKLDFLPPAVTVPEPKPVGATPSHVIFTDKVLGIAPLPMILDRPLWVKNPDPIYFSSFRRCGDWVNRGEPIVSFIVKKRILRDFVFATVRSPISGRLIYTSGVSPFDAPGKPIGGGK